MSVVEVKEEQMDNIEAKKILFNIQQSNIKTWDKDVLEALEEAIKALGENNDRLNEYELKINELGDMLVKIDAVYKDYEDCRNELCLKCGSYKEAHKGACNGCRWKR